MEASRSDCITVLGLSISEKKRSRNVAQRRRGRTAAPCVRGPGSPTSCSALATAAGRGPRAPRRGPARAGLQFRRRPPGRTVVQRVSAARGGGGAGTGEVRRPPGAGRGRRATLPFPPAPRPLLGPGTRSRLFASFRTSASTRHPQPESPDEMGSGRQTPGPGVWRRDPPHTHTGVAQPTGVPSAPRLPPSLLLEGRWAWGGGLPGPLRAGPCGPEGVRRRFDAHVGRRAPWTVWRRPEQPPARGPVRAPPPLPGQVLRVGAQDPERPRTPGS